MRRLPPPPMPPMQPVPPAACTSFIRCDIVLCCAAYQSVTFTVLLGGPARPCAVILYRLAPVVHPHIMPVTPPSRFLRLPHLLRPIHADTAQPQPSLYLLPLASLQLHAPRHPIYRVYRPKLNEPKFELLTDRHCFFRFRGGGV